MTHPKVEDRGVELPQDFTGNTPLSETCGTESGTLDARAVADAGLAAVAEAWDWLSESSQKSILEIVAAQLSTNGSSSGEPGASEYPKEVCL
jgi:hypothetical protein